MKNVYIAGALACVQNLDEVRQLYERFAESCRIAGWNPFVPHHNGDPQIHRDVSATTIFQSDLAHIKDSAAVVMYLGQPSTGVGYELAKAMELSIPILAVFEKDRVVSRLALGALEEYPFGHMCSFAEVENCYEWITETLRNLGRVEE